MFLRFNKTHCESHWRKLSLAATHSRCRCEKIITLRVRKMRANIVACHVISHDTRCKQRYGRRRPLRSDDGRRDGHQPNPIGEFIPKMCKWEITTNMIEVWSSSAWIKSNSLCNFILGTNWAIIQYLPGPLVCPLRIHYDFERLLLTIMHQQ